MSRTATARFEWAGEERTFRLAVRQLEELQDACDAGPQYLYELLASGLGRQKYIAETLRLGLIGGGMPAAEADRLVKRNIFPLADNVLPAMTVLAAVVQGVPDERPKESGETVPPKPIFPEQRLSSAPFGAGPAQ